MVVILLLIQHMFQIQFRYDPETDVILTLIQYMCQIQFRYDQETEVILLLIQISTSYTVQIRSRHGSHFVTHSTFFTSPEML